MLREQGEQKMIEPIKGGRPVADKPIPPGRRFRNPVVQVEIERRVNIYAEQVAMKGYFTWLPYRGSGE
ncbi:MAG: hypothetical protein HZA50_13890 [Planctomycetes bacterium]|nr:hypothetical protein [Planctomycetota bacterium]